MDGPHGNMSCNNHKVDGFGCMAFQQNSKTGRFLKLTAVLLRESVADSDRSAYLESGSRFNLKTSQATSPCLLFLY